MAISNSRATEAVTVNLAPNADAGSAAPCDGQRPPAAGFHVIRRRETQEVTFHERTPLRFRA